MSSSSGESLRRVLIASANPLFAKGLRKMVAERWKNRPVEFRIAGSMDEARTALETWQPDLIIVDYDDITGNIQRGAFLSHFIEGARPMQVMLVSLRESGEVVVYDRRAMTPAEAEDWLDLPWQTAAAEPAAAAAEAAAGAEPAAGARPAAQAYPAPVRSSEPQPPAGKIPHSRSAGMKKFVIVGAIAVVFMLLLGFGLSAADLTPRPSSAQAGPIDAMIHLQTWLIAGLFALIVTFILASWWNSRHRDRSEYGAAFKGSTGLEVAWTLVPLALVIVLSFVGAQDLAAIRQVDPQALNIHVTAFQWGWLFEYPDLGIQSNTMYMPVDRQARITLTSRDVIHSFWVPEFRVKQDALPGENLVKEVRITPVETGEYKVRCAEMCGGAHALMESPVVVVSQDEFDDWAAEQGDVEEMTPEERGQRLAQAQGCLTCHSLDGSTIVGPTWKGLYESEVPLADGSTVTADEDYIHTSIVEPNAQVHEGFPPGIMQSYEGTLSEEEIADIIEFIETVD
jgi:cytochrome c oxidase subunit 2